MKGLRNLRGMTARRPKVMLDETPVGREVSVWGRGALPYSVQWQYAVRMACGCLYCGQTLCDPDKSRDSAAAVLREGHRKLWQVAHGSDSHICAEHHGSPMVMSPNEKTVH